MGKESYLNLLHKKICVSFHKYLQSNLGRILHFIKKAREFFLISNYESVYFNMKTMHTFELKHLSINLIGLGNNIFNTLVDFVYIS